MRVERAAVGRPGEALCPSDVSTASRSTRPRPSASAEQTAGTDRPAEPDRAGPAVRRGRRHPRHRARLHHPVGVRPALLRPAARRPTRRSSTVRRPEDLVRGVPRDHQRRRRRGRRPLPRRRDGGQRREILCGRTRPAHVAGLRPVARRHRRDVGARPAPVPAAGHAVPLDVRHAGRPQPAGLRAHRRNWSPRHDRDDVGAHRDHGVGRTSSPHGRARGWPRTCPASIPTNPPDADRGEEAPWLRARELQKKLYDGGFAGICFPREYGGLGLPIAYQKAFDDESRDYEMPMILNTPTFTICAATILDTGSEEQKRQHISAALRGDEVLVQLLSEPSGGSDLAGVITRADRRRRQVGRSTAQRRGAQARSPPTTGCCWPGPTGTCPSTRA